MGKAIDTMRRDRLIYNSTLLAMTIVIWRQIIIAQFHDYDDDIADIIIGLFFSLFSIIGLVFLWFVKRQTIKESRWQTILFLAFNSPLTIIPIVILLARLFKN